MWPVFLELSHPSLQHLLTCFYCVYSSLSGFFPHCTLPKFKSDCVTRLVKTNSWPALLLGSKWKSLTQPIIGPLSVPHLCSLVAASQTSHPDLCSIHADLFAAPQVCHVSSDYIAWKQLPLYAHVSLCPSYTYLIEFSSTLSSKVLP